LKHNSIQDKDFLDSLVIDAKKIVRLAHARARECESFRKALKDEQSEAGSQPAIQNVAHKHNPTGELGRECNNE
jgi:hypothetical protein